MDVTRVPIIRTSERVLFKRCMWAWWRAYREGLKSKRVADALWFGELLHIALAAWYCGPGILRGPHPAETFEKLCNDELRYAKTQDATEEEAAKYTELHELGLAMLNGYIELYGKDEQWLVVSPEQTFSFDIPFPEWWGEDIRALLARYAGTFDLVYRDAETGWLWLGEHKSAATVRTDHLPLDEQGGSYWAVAARALAKAGLIGEGERLKGIMYNFLRKGMPDERPRDAQGYACNKPIKQHYIAALNDFYPSAALAKAKLEQLEDFAKHCEVTVLGERSKVQPKPLFVRFPVPRTRAERKNQLLRIQTDAALMELARRGEIPITKTPHWSCNRCAFYEICRLHETSGNWEDLKRIGFNVEDPYADHRKSTDEVGSFEL